MVVRYERRSNSYRDLDTDEVVPRGDIEIILVAMVADLKLRLRDIAIDLNEGRIDIDRFQQRMAEEIKLYHLQAAGLAAGGVDRLSDVHYEDINNRLDEEFIGFLFGFGIALEAGRVSKDQILNRAQLYARSLIRSFTASEKITRISDGANEGRRFLDPAAQHCFVVGTPVFTDRGDMPIEKLRKGDRVLTRNGLRKVRETYEARYQNQLYQIEVNGKVVTCTYNHPFWTKNRGWVEARDLTEDDELLILT